ncbi:MAG: hypothetical protein AAGF47_06515 [Planctomycetota bacterium]
MTGTLLWYWLGSVLLAAVGGWLGMRGFFGNRRIASLTRRCPRCKYDMTGRPDAMTCAECGLTAKHESQWYGGRRWLWPIVLSGAMLVSSFALGSWPITRQTGYLALLPLRVQVEVWPTWTRFYHWAMLGSESEERGIEQLGRSVADSDNRSLERAFVRSGIAGIRSSRDPRVARTIAYVLSSVGVWPDVGTVSEDDVLYLLAGSTNRLRNLGVSYIGLIENPSGGFAGNVDTICAEQGLDTARVRWIRHNVDRLLGFPRTAELLRSSDPADAEDRVWAADMLGRLAANHSFHLASYPRYAEQNRADFDLVEQFVLDGHPGVTRGFIVGILSYNYVSYGASADAPSLTYRSVLSPRVESMLTQVFRSLNEDGTGEIASICFWVLESYPSAPIRLATSRLSPDTVPEVARRMLGLVRGRLEFAGVLYAADAIVDLDRFSADPTADPVFAVGASQLAEELRALLPDEHRLTAPSESQPGN